MILSLERNANLLWDKKANLVRDYNACKDFTMILLDGCVMAMMSKYRHPDVRNTKHFERDLGDFTKDQLATMIERIVETTVDLETVSRLRSHGGQSRGVRQRTGENILLFVQHMLMFGFLDSAIRHGDSGRIVNALHYFVLWFQDTSASKYSTELLRLVASLQRCWSPRLKKFWMDNCVVNLSGKKKGFIPLDMFNEYVVREVKVRLAQVGTPEAEDRVCRIDSLVIMDLLDIKKKMNLEMESDPYGFHSSPVAKVVDIRKVANEILAGGFLPLAKGQTDMEVYDECVDAYDGKDLFMDGMRKLATSDKIAVLKAAMEGERMESYSDFEEEDLSDADDEEVEI
jgi:hypothetical protein